MSKLGEKKKTKKKKKRGGGGGGEAGRRTDKEGRNGHKTYTLCHIGSTAAQATIIDSKDLRFPPLCIFLSLCLCLPV